MSEEIFYAFLNSPFGKIGIASSSSGIVYVSIGINENAFSRVLKHKFKGNIVKSKRENIQAINELKSYLKGNLEVFKSKLSLKGTPFQIKVWNNTKKIPYGKMRSYKFIACKTATLSHSRAVGNAIAKNPVPIFIPCHRVIKSDGSLGNYVPGKDIKRKLLKLEGTI